MTYLDVFVLVFFSQYTLAEKKHAGLLLPNLNVNEMIEKKTPIQMAGKNVYANMP